MRKYNFNTFGIAILVLICFFVSVNDISAFHREKESSKSSKTKKISNITASNPYTTIVDINNITCYIAANGEHDNIWDQSYNGSFPKGTTGVIYREGIIWGGKVNDGRSQIVAVCGNTYDTGCEELSRPFRVRTDYATADLSDDAAQFNAVAASKVTEAMITEMYEQYETDWQDWPADLGAPYDDVDSNGVYDPDVDIPGIPGASQTVWIYYDDSNSAAFEGSQPVGIEVQETYWAYAYTGALGNVIFKKMDLEYVGLESTPSNANIEDMYITQWADPDVGTYSDDYAGCDTTLNLGYAYNAGATDQTYTPLGMIPPAVGYDFFQGVSLYTGDMNDSAVVDLKWQKGYKYVSSNQLSTFVYFSAAGGWEDPTLNDYEGTLQWYNLMRGKKPVPEYPNGEDFPEDVTEINSEGGAYLLPGDPVTGEGKIDGQYEGSADRRICNVTGPFDLQLGEKVQIVVSLLAAQGTSNINSVAKLKQYDLTAQTVFDQLFQLPNVPAPSVQVTNLDQKVILNWGYDASAVNKLENYSSQGYSFQGYRVYQLPTASASLEDSELLATYDLIDGITAIADTIEDSGFLIPDIIVEGNDVGITRSMIIDEDKVRGKDLFNGQEYYFKVVPYAYNPVPLLPFHVAEPSVPVLTAIPQIPVGESYSSAIGDTIEVAHATGNGAGSVIAIVVDPTSVTGHSYKVSFDDSGDETTWSLTDLTTDEVVLADQTNQSDDDDYMVVDGILVKPLGPSLGINSIVEENQAGVVVDPTVSILDLALGSTGYILNNSAGDVNLPATAADFDRFDYWGTDDVIINFGEESLTWDYISEEVHTTSGGTPYMAPFSVYRIKATGETIRLFAGFRDVDSNGTWDASIVDASFNKPAYELMFAWQGYDADGNEIAYDPANIDQYVADNALSTSAYITWGGSTGEFTYPYLTNTLVTLYTATATYPAGNLIRFTTNKVSTSADTFTFTAPTVEESDELAKEDVKMINVFPNPYYGYHYREQTRADKYVTFSHLPTAGKIRIFDLSGVLVNTIDIADNIYGGQFVNWNLQNHHNYPVASGIYVVHIDMPDLGETKILKLAIIQEEQILKNY